MSLLLGLEPFQKILGGFGWMVVVVVVVKGILEFHFASNLVLRLEAGTKLNNIINPELTKWWRIFVTLPIWCFTFIDEIFQSWYCDCTGIWNAPSYVQKWLPSNRSISHLQFWHILIQFSRLWTPGLSWWNILCCNCRQIPSSPPVFGCHVNSRSLIKHLLINTPTQALFARYHGFWAQNY